MFYFSHNLIPDVKVGFSFGQHDYNFCICTFLVVFFRKIWCHRFLLDVLPCARSSVRQRYGSRYRASSPLRSTAQVSGSHQLKSLQCSLTSASPSLLWWSRLHCCFLSFYSSGWKCRALNFELRPWTRFPCNKRRVP